MTSKTDFPLVILAGGQGSRLKKIHSDLPKILKPIGEKVFLDYFLENLFRLGFKNLIFIIQDDNQNVLATTTQERTNVTGINGKDFTDIVSYTGVDSNYGNIFISGSKPEDAIPRVPIIFNCLEYIKSNRSRETIALSAVGIPT